MKNIIILLIGLISVLGCKKDELKITQDNLIGLWNLDTRYAEGEVFDLKECHELIYITIDNSEGKAIWNSLLAPSGIITDPNPCNPEEIKLLITTFNSDIEIIHNVEDPHLVFSSAKFINKNKFEFSFTFPLLGFTFKDVYIKEN